jgi:hypothetical protein
VYKFASVMFIVICMKSLLCQIQSPEVDTKHRQDLLRTAVNFIA